MHLLLQHPAIQLYHSIDTHKLVPLHLQDQNLQFQFPQSNLLTFYELLYLYQQLRVLSLLNINMHRLC